MTADEIYMHYLVLEIARRDAQAIKEFKDMIARESDELAWQRKAAFPMPSSIVFSEQQIKYAQDEIDKIIETSKQELKRLNLPNNKRSTE